MPCSNSWRILRSGDTLVEAVARRYLCGVECSGRTLRPGSAMMRRIAKSTG